MFCILFFSTDVWDSLNCEEPNADRNFSLLIYVYLLLRLTIEDDALFNGSFSILLYFWTWVLGIIWG